MKSSFQPSSTSGVSFPNDDRTPTISVRLSYPAEVQSVTIPRDKTPNANVQQFEVTFYSSDGKKVNNLPIISKLSPSDNKSQPAELDYTQIPSTTLVSLIEITIVQTTDGESPKGVILDVKICSKPTTFSGTSTGTTITTTTSDRCRTENVLGEEFGLVEATAINEATKGETKVIGYSIRVNGTGWTPSSAFSSLNIEFRYPIEVYY